MLPLSRLDCPLSLKTPNMGNPGVYRTGLGRANSPVSLPLSLPSVYPRVCGGTSETLRHVNYMQGLSPRVRGNQHH